MSTEDTRYLTGFGGMFPQETFKIEHSGGVYMRKQAPARVSYRHDFLISYRIYMMTGSFHISVFKVHFMLMKCTYDFKSQTLRMH